MMGKEHCQIIGLLFAFFVAVTFFSSGSAAENNKGEVRRKRNIICFLGLTGLISDVFYDALKSVRKLDPLFIGSLLNGRFQNGTLRGLSTLTNNTKINVYCKNKNISLDTVLGVKDVSFSFLWSVKVILVKFKGTISVKVDDIQFQLDATLDLDSGVVLDIDVELMTLDGLSIGISGFGPLDYAIELVADAVLDFFQHFISHKIKSALETTLKSELNKHNLLF